MAKQSLASMTVEALLKLKDDVAAALSGKADDLRQQLSRLGGGSPRRGRPPGRSSLAGRKVAAKYRGPDGVTWAGRGAMPVWMREAIKGGKKPDDFLISKPAKGMAAKKSRKKRKMRKGRKAA